MKFYTIVTLWLIGLISLQAQTGGIKGKIIDAKTKEAIAYANISVFTAQDSLVTGSISNEKGKFIIKNIPADKYRILIGFMGYDNVEYKNFLITESLRDMGIIPMKVSRNQLKEVVIESGKSPVTYQVDRKIIHASAFPEATVAVDLLENIPSLKIDISGKITYRNDAVFQVFINGKPVSNGVERLQQIPTNRIDRIEIITNPSAKYSAEGTAGIINVVLKKNRLQGYRINSSATYHTSGQYGFLFSIGRNSKRSEWHLDTGIAEYRFDLDYHSLMQLNHNEQTQILDEKGNKKNVIGRNYINFGYNYDLTDKDEIDISFNIDPFSKTENHDETGIYIEKIYDNDQNLFYDETYGYTGSDHMTYQYMGPSMSYTHKFDKAGDKKLEFSAEYYTYVKKFNEIQINQKQFDDHTEKSGSIYSETNEKNWDLSADLTYPFNDNFHLETGGSISLDYIPKTTVFNGNFTENNQLTPYPEDYHYQEVEFNRDIYSAYLTGNYTWEKWGLKTGLRYEFVDRTANFTYNYTDDPDKMQIQPYRHRYADWFPSIHLQYSFDKTRQISVSYSRRISRPNYFWLMPAKQYFSPFSYMTGDEKVQPTYINSYEINYQKSWDKDYFSAQIFVHQKNNLNTRYNRVDDKGLRYVQVTNAGDSFNIGVELNGNYHLFSWWNINLSMSAYQYYMHLFIPGEIDQKTDRLESNIQLHQDFKLPKDLKLQLKARYDSPWIYLQNKGDAVWKLQISLQKRFDKHWKFSVYTNNLWGDILKKSQVQAQDVIVHSENRFLQYLGFKLSYNFNNRK